MNILVVTQYFWPENFRINDLVAELVVRGHEVTVLTGYPNYPDGVVLKRFIDNPSEFQEFEGATIIRVPLIPRGNSAVQLLSNYISFVVTGSCLGPYKLRGKKFDQIFVAGLSPITVGIPAIVMKWLKRAPIVFWVLDLWPDSLHAVGVVRSQRILGAVGFMVRLIYHPCDVILAQSRTFIPKIQQFCRPGKRIEFFPSWAETIFEKQGQLSAPELDQFDGFFKVLFAGNIGESQDFPAILDAAERLRKNQRIRWILVGDGRMSPWVKAEIHRRNLTENVKMLGSFPLERMPSFYAGADALLVTLKKSDAFSMTIPGKVQSYLAARRPLLGMLDGEGAAVIAESKAGIVCSAGDSMNLARICEEMAEAAPERRNDMAENGHAYYKREFHRERLMDRIEDIFYTLKPSRRNNEN